MLSPPHITIITIMIIIIIYQYYSSSIIMIMMVILIIESWCSRCRTHALLEAEKAKSAECEVAREKAQKVIEQMQKDGCFWLVLSREGGVRV